MAFDVVMPQMGESIAEATVLEWFKQVGEAVEKDENLYSISTDKVDAEIPAPEAGILLEILAAPNQTVPVGAVVARIGQPQEVRSASSQPQLAAETTPEALPTMPRQVLPSHLEDRLKTHSSPLVRKMAEIHGIDLLKVPGTGHLGRVTKEDLEHYLQHKTKPQTAPPAQAAPVLPHDPSAPTLRLLPIEAETDAVSSIPQPERVRIEPMSRMRKIISENMLASKRSSAHVYTVWEFDMGRISRLRTQHGKAFQEQFGVKLSYLPFVLKAVCKALRAHPILNASVEGDQIRFKLDIHLGVAVALDWGLIVPVVKQADQLSLGGLARVVADLAERARKRQLKPEEIQGGTFSITNPGVFGDTFGLPIILQPQVAILGMGAIKKRPVVVTDSNGQDLLAIRPTMFSGLSFDHRIIDGAEADQFMAVIKQELENSNFGLE